MMASMLCDEHLHILPKWEKVFLLPWVEERGLQTAELCAREPMWLGKPMGHGLPSAADVSCPPCFEANCSHLQWPPGTGTQIPRSGAQLRGHLHVYKDSQEMLVLQNK